MLKKYFSELDNYTHKPENSLSHPKTRFCSKINRFRDFHDFIKICGTCENRLRSDMVISSGRTPETMFLIINNKFPTPWHLRKHGNKMIKR